LFSVPRVGLGKQKIGIKLIDMKMLIEDNFWKIGWKNVSDGFVERA
jgi:hypothetical protein